MKKQLIIPIAIISSFFIVIASFLLFKYFRVKNATKIVNLKTNEIEVYSEIKLKDLIKNINGKLLTNPKINTTKLGKQQIEFEYINDDNIKIPYSIEINVVDKTPPMITKFNKFSVTVDYEGDLSKELFCGDNYDNNPKCHLEGNYDLSKVGSYTVTFVGIDSSNNKSTNTFILNVKEKSKNNNQETEEIHTDFNDILKKYKNSNTKVGIDVSHWQGDIDFKKVKEAGVEFAYIRVGRGSGIGGKYVLDEKFEQNIKGFNKVGIPVGVYFYSYANSKNDAEKEAKWLIKKIKNYQVDLELAFDWENWSSFQEFDLSFYKLSELAKTFSKTIQKAGYQGMLYSSKTYLEDIWYKTDTPVWLAHYTSNTDYQGKYKVWQLCNNGKVSGIDDNLVDINIMYK